MEEITSPGPAGTAGREVMSTMETGQLLAEAGILESDPKVRFGRNKFFAVSSGTVCQGVWVPPQGVPLGGSVAVEE